MAIGFVRIERVKRSKGKNACCKSAYNARTKILDQKTGEIFNFTKLGGNTYHEVLLPSHVDSKFKNLSELTNAIEHIERKNNSQLLKEYVLALPDDKNISHEIKIEMIHEFVRRMNWIEDGLGVQIDVHAPHDGENNWHAHILTTTRRFTEDGKRLGEKSKRFRATNKKWKKWFLCSV